MPKFRNFGLLVMALLMACARGGDPAQRALSQATGRSVRPYCTRDFGRQHYSGACSVLVEPERAEGLLAKVRAQLPSGYVAFIGTVHSLADPPAQGTELVVAPGTSQFDILRVAASDAVNYDLSTEDLIRQLQTWDQQVGIDIYQASTDSIGLRLKSVPDALPEFAARVYRLCPDIVDQGLGNIEALQQQIQHQQRLDLWWD
ncbi:MAG: DUF4253 domain-containing protein [Candidatus Eremiobacteraeota bacterium]|nr:DUF4253 domain-containing protein [Candidatus Eremiobacteraeota bacterium]